MKHPAGTHPANTARGMLVAAMLGSCYLDFFRYKAGGFDDPHALDMRLLGQSPAPEQYRIGVYWLAHALVTALHIAPTMVLALLDGLAALIAVLLLFSVLERSATYTRASSPLRWLAASAFVLLVLWFMAWLPWLQKPETLPTAAFVAAMLWLWQPQLPSASQGWKALALLALTSLLATFRADVACLLNLGICLYLLSHGEPLSLPRRAALSTAALSALAAGGIQLWLMRIVFPAATYGRVKIWQLWPNLKHASRWPPFVVFLLPLAWLAVQALHRRFPEDAAASRAFFTAAALYMALWITIGKIDEVRIFLPFALALAPLTVQTLLQRVEPS